MPLPTADDLLVAPLIKTRWLDYTDRLDVRRLGDIDTMVIHCTELPDLSTARQYGETIHHPVSQTGNSGHYYIDRDGSIEQWVPLERVAHHVRGYNRHSVGVELVNTGRFPNWYDSKHQAMTEPYPVPQIEALLALIMALREPLPCLNGIAGHEDLDRENVPSSDDPDTLITRKCDPGPLFPWTSVLENCGLQRIHPRQ